ncbi:heme exporter protein CcmD [Algibacillus agarilyticus]|uniref:heme exporter protein CcmD n=1 Tax=Algibacillus agarilyticus TaxID=2234133 RepID=UPI000DCF9B11|nr:heme exporter protein CcmD [Algibacillus agarilyticus]
MQFDSVQQFLAMGGYAAYVWSGVGLVFALLIGLFYFSKVERKAMFKHIEQKLEIEKRRRKQQNSEMTL